MVRASRIVGFLLSLAASGLLGCSVCAQEAVVNIASGPSDILYAQSELLRSIDEAWFIPLSQLEPFPNDRDTPRAVTLPVVFSPDKQPKESSNTDIRVNPQDQKKDKDREGHFRWAPAFGESILYTGIMHTFDLTTEAGTRDTLNGHWFTHYVQSVSELRGWSDGDTFMAPYVGHPIEGSVFGFIERQNDPRYRLVQWGDGRDYWVSMFRSLAYSAVWHTQWKIGPVSEASIGNVMLHASPGFITLVDTPTLGFCTMLAEDAADRYLIMGLENRTSNRTVLVLARSFLNPGRTFANMMAFRPPWVRDTRMNLFGDSYLVRKALLEDYKNGEGEKPFIYVKDAWKPEGVEFVHQPRPKEADIELTAFPYYETFLGGGSCVGGGGTGAARVNPKLQVITEVSGCLIMHQPAVNVSADSLVLRRRVPLDADGGAKVFAVYAIPVWRAQSDAGNHGSRVADEAVGRMERRQRDLAALPEAERLLDRDRAEWTEHRGGRRVRLGGHAALRVAGGESGVHAHVDERCRANPPARRS